jgi:hypothetical protein
MYCAYQLAEVKFGESSGWLTEGKRLEVENLQRVRGSLESFVGTDGEIDASRMMTDWFGGVSADVFISHSRADKDLALTIAGWLSKELDVSSFVDSCAWGHANILLRQIDDAFCKTGGATYSYFHSTVTASHVHLMLSTALSQMLDRCECVFFLNSEHSLKSVSVRSMAESEEDYITQSPWLFHELSMLRLIRRREKEEHRPGIVKSANFAEAKAHVPAFNYPVSLAVLPALGVSELKLWHKQWSDEKREKRHALDCLYDIRLPDCLRTIVE